MSLARIGSAPVSFGVYGPATEPGVSPMTLLDSAVRAGFRGMELGPPGFFGTPAATAEAFADRGLTMVGAYVPIHFSADDETAGHDLAGMERTLTELSAVGSSPGLAILADEGSPELLRNPARSPDDRGLALDDAGWRRLADRVAAVLETAGTAGVPTSFHPHVSTYVESPWEVERLLETTAVDLTLDTGHFWLAGADPTESLGRFGDRINHVHLKDVQRSVLERAKAAGRTDFDVWWADVATPLGAGDLDIPAFLEALLRLDYTGWLVIEQDRLPLSDASIASVVAEQAANLQWLQDQLGALSAPSDTSTMEPA